MHKQLSGLDLRRAALLAADWKPAVYWDITREEVVAWLNTPESEWDRPWGKTLGSRMPAIESDPGVSEPMFLEWLSRCGYWAEVELDPLSTTIDLHRKTRWTTILTVTGSTPSEARARAIVAAEELQK